MSFWTKMGGAGKRVVGSPVEGAKKLLAVEQIKENFGWMKSAAGTLMPSSVKRGRVETFERAMERQRVSHEDLDKFYTNYVLKFWISTILLATGWMVAILYLLDKQWLVLFPIVGFSAICLSQMFVASFRAYQLTNRKFCDVSEWIANRSAWVPWSFELPPPPKPIGSRSRVVAPVVKARPPVKGK